MSKEGYKQPHVLEAEDAMDKAGLTGEDWYAARYLTGIAPADLFCGYQGANGTYFVLPYVNHAWDDNRLAFTTKAKAKLFASKCGVRFRDADEF